jgi:hypothetical protein
LKYNVILFVLDTLREDYSKGLYPLESEGFKRYENALTPAPWTLPTHVSIFTGVIPSKHEAHERAGSQYYELHPDARRAMSRNSTILSSLSNEGYQTYAFSSNPLISRRFGFAFDYYHDFSKDPRENELNEFLSANKVGENKGQLATLSLLIKKRKLRLLSYAIYNKKVKKQINASLRRKPSQPDKMTRSRRFSDELKSLKFSEPFFLFVNLMEAHEPYFRGKEKEDAFLHRQFAIITNSDYQSKRLDIRDRYAKDAELSTSKLIEMVQILKPYYDSSIIIVTSDHGQLLGEENKYGHGYFLNNELLRVPLYVRYPSSCKPLGQLPRSVISLTEIPRIATYASNENRDHFENGFTLGSDYAISESFGMMSDCSNFAKNEEQLRMFRASYCWKVKIQLAGGSAIYNTNSDLFEEIQGDINEAEARNLISKVVSKDSSIKEKISSSGQANDNEVFSDSEIKDLEAKLSTLGYS